MPDDICICNIKCPTYCDGSCGCKKCEEEYLRWLSGDYIESEDDQNDCDYYKDFYV